MPKVVKTLGLKVPWFCQIYVVWKLKSSWMFTLIAYDNDLDMSAALDPAKHPTDCMFPAPIRKASKKELDMVVMDHHQRSFLLLRLFHWDSTPNDTCPNSDGSCISEQHVFDVTDHTFLTCLRNFDFVIWIIWLSNFSRYWQFNNPNIVDKISNSF